MTEQKNLVIAIAASMLILISFHYFYERPKQQEIIANIERGELAANQLPSTKNSDVASNGVKSGQVVAPTQIIDRKIATSSPHRIMIETNRLRGSINLHGAVIDDLTLTDYRETTEQDSETVKLLSPANTKEAYFIQTGWQTIEGTWPAVDAMWKTEDTKLSVGNPVHLTYENGNGLTVARTIKLDEDYMFSVIDRVTNTSDRPIVMTPFSKINRNYTPELGGYMILHEGLLGILDGKLEEFDYSDVLEDKRIEKTSTGGWLGFTDKYWLVALVPNQKMPIQAFFEATPEDITSSRSVHYGAGYRGNTIKLEPGKTQEFTQHVFAGAKILNMLDSYEEKLNFENFDKAIDFGWFYFITKPVFYLLEWLNKLFGNFGLAILVMTVLFKIALFPMANKSYRSMSRMKKFQPRIQQLKERYAHDKMAQNQAMMDLYQKEKVNPMSGCLPMIIQAPIFFCLYKVLFVTIEMRHAPFYGWITDLSQPDPTSLFNLFGLIPIDLPSFLHIGLWPILMGLSMWVQQKLNPQPADPMQAKMFMIMPLMMVFLFSSFPAGLVIYWFWSNLLSIIQQKAIMRLEEDNAK